RSRAPAASAPAAGAQSRGPKPALSLKHFLGRAAQNRSYLDRLAASYSTRSGRSRSPRSDLVGLFRAFHINDPVAGQEFLGFGKNPVCDWRPVLSRTDDPGLIGKGQALGGHEHAGILEFLVECVHEGEIRLKVFLGPLHVGIKFSFRAL